jgi:ribonuclease Z
MQVITLGTGCPLPDPDRAGPATLVRAAGRNLLFDCGRAVLMRAAAVPVGPGGFNAVFLTHLHSDHVSDLNDVITMQWAMSMVAAPLRIVGPIGTATFVERTLAMLRDDIGYRVTHHDDLTWEPIVEVTEVTDGVVWDQDGIRVQAEPTDHRPVHPTVGYRIEAEGSTVAIAGDTKPCAGLDRLCADADIYVQTVVRRSAIEAFPVPRLLDVLDDHSDLAEAADTAARNRVVALGLTHPVPAPPVGREPEADWVAEPALEFAGEIVLAHDLQVFEAPSQTISWSRTTS